MLILTRFVTNRIFIRNLNCKGFSSLKDMRTCLQMPKFIFPVVVKMGIIAMWGNLRIFDDLDESGSAFYLLFPFN